MERYLTPKGGRRRDCASAAERSRRERWRAKGAARVVHQTRGTVVVPCSSPFSALLCAAELWGCSWMEIRDAGVWRAEPGDRVETMPYII